MKLLVPTGVSVSSDEPSKFLKQFSKLFPGKPAFKMLRGYPTLCLDIKSIDHNEKIDALHKFATNLQASKFKSDDGVYVQWKLHKGNDVAFARAQLTFSELSLEISHLEIQQ